MHQKSLFGDQKSKKKYFWGGGSAHTQNFSFDFWSPNSDFWCTVGAIYGSVDCFGRRQPLHDSIMSVTGVIAGS